VGVLPLLGACVVVGVVDLLKAHRNHDRGDAIAVVIIWLILVPSIALWTRRKGPAKSDQR
jgi:hypothetical protein